jgi:membrane protein YqaA with SNARE-associated domain
VHNLRTPTVPHSCDPLRSRLQWPSSGKRCNVFPSPKHEPTRARSLLCPSKPSPVTHLPSTIASRQFWIPAFTEILSATAGRAGFPPVIVGLLCASGQCTLFTLLFFFGERISSRWQWLRRRVDSVLDARRKLFERSSFALVCGAALVGVPPTVPLFTLAPSLNMRLAPMLLLMFPLRCLRFAIICALGSIPISSMFSLAGLPAGFHPLTWQPAASDSYAAAVALELSRRMVNGSDAGGGG